MEAELVMEVAEVITAQDTARSLWIIYQQMPVAVQKVFRDMLDGEGGNEYVNADWLRLSGPTLKELWDSPEEDYWDELYAKQHPDK